MKQNPYAQYDVPQNLQFKTADIVKMGGLNCMVCLRPCDFEGVLSAPNKITRASVTLAFSVATNAVSASLSASSAWASFWADFPHVQRCGNISTPMWTGSMHEDANLKFEI